MPLTIAGPPAPIGAVEFAGLLESLGPFEPEPGLAVAVSGGADSLATAVLVADWVRARGGTILALVVDHGLRLESADEAAATLRRLAGLGIAGHLIELPGLAAGAGLAARARSARHDALEAACRAHGILHLVFGHHAGDQAETIAMRMLAQSGADGLAGMAAIVETRDLRRLRPLLAMPKARLIATLQQLGIAWVEDPSNRNPNAQRVRLRDLRRDPNGCGLATRALVAASLARGADRAAQEAAVAEELAARAALYPQGFAVLSPGPISPQALARLIAMTGGAGFSPAHDRLAALAAAPRPATIAGVRLAPAGRLGPGLLVLREFAAIAAPIPADPAQIWDHRFRMVTAAPAGGMIGAWGADAVSTRTGLPMLICRTLPVLRCNGVVITATPALCRDFEFCPPLQAGPAPFFPLPGLAGKRQDSPIQGDAL